MRILFIVPYAPTPIRTRPYNLLRGLTRRGHDITLATLWQNAGEQAALAEWRAPGVRVIAEPLSTLRSGANLLRALAGAAPLQAAFCWQPALARRIAGELAATAYDVVHVEHLRGARYALAAKEQGAGRAAVVWDSVDCISHLFAQTARASSSAGSRVKAWLDVGRTRRYEAWLPEQFDRVLVTSVVDRDAFERLHVGTFERWNVQTFERSNVPTVLPNGVDLAYFQPGVAARSDLDIVFSGKMSYHANVTAVAYFAGQVLPLIWARQPQATFTIAGHSPPAGVRALASDARIRVTGSVDDLRPYLQQAALAVAPMPYGAGIQNKVLEALACATPVVATPQAVSALAVRAGEHLLVADGAANLAAAVLRLLDDGALRVRLGAAGRRYAEENHDWAGIVARLEDIYCDAIRRTRGGA